MLEMLWDELFTWLCRRLFGYSQRDLDRDLDLLEERFMDVAAAVFEMQIRHFGRS